MRFHIITLFPGMFDSYIGESILKRAKKKTLVRTYFYNPRDFTENTHRTADDKPYGGGPGMVLMALPILKAVEAAKSAINDKASNTKKVRGVKIIIFSPGGRELTNAFAERLSKNYSDIILIAGRYEGIDARVKKVLNAEEVSIGRYTLTGGELPAMVLIDTVSRRVSGVLGARESIEEKRNASRVMYTRPDTLLYRGKKYRVPKVLRSGHHVNIENWRLKRRGS